ncbi:MAG: serine hydrolase [Saprospiraceae bacterium]
MRYNMICLLLAVAFSGIAQKNVLEDIIKENQHTFGEWVNDPAAYDIQVLYTRIDRDADGQPHFTTYRFGVDPNTYFYPASTVKMPTALLALEKINELGIDGLDKHTPMQNLAGRAPQTAALSDTSAANGLPSVGHYVRKIFLTSDNDAHNRLYEFLGQAWINERLHAKGLTESRIIHRLSVSGYDTLGNRYTNPVAFYNDQGMCYYQGEGYSRFYDDLGLSGQLKGVAYINDNEERIAAPFDFRYKNFLSIQDLNDMLRALIFPQSVAPTQRFKFTEDDYRFVYKAMAQFPRESDYPRYQKPDNYVKFWMYGDEMDENFQMPSNVRILNKVGWAYGYLTDAAYIVDTAAGVEFMLTGTILVNKNQTFNDGEYEYESVGLPFFGALGRAVYEHELARKRKHPADVQWVKELLAE